MWPACAVLELRQYTLHPGRREALIALFEEHLIEPQEDCGMRVIGQFRDLDRPDRFVWLRGFDDMAARTRALECFYDGPVWKAHRDAANATMIDSDDVLLLKPAGDEAALRFDPRERPPRGAGEASGGVIVATIHSFLRPVDAAFLSWFRAEGVPALAAAGTSVLAALVTEPAPNGFPRLPVREGENVLVWLASYPDREAEAAASRALEALPHWRERLLPGPHGPAKRAPERLVLAPTPRSLLR